MQQLIVSAAQPKIEPMVIDDEKLAFAERLNATLDARNYPEKGRGRQIALGKDMGVSQNGARKWLEGESMPEIARMVEMAKRFNVSFEWLATGRNPTGSENETKPVLNYSETVTYIANLAETLTPTQQEELISQLEALSKQNDKMLEELSARKLHGVPTRPAGESQLLSNTPAPSEQARPTEPHRKQQ